ncbi:MAG: adenylate kinase family protein [Thermoplasmatota archaeon]
MVTALTGTPGTGKTTIAKHLREDGYDVLGINDFIEKNGLKREEDEFRDTFNVDIEELKEFYQKKAPSHEIVEGHLSHHLDVDKIIVLRCAPKELRERMKSKDWRDRKKKENIEAEVLDIILVEAMDLLDEVFEIDTTNKKPEEIKKAVIDILKGRTKRYRPGKIDWSEDYLLKE